jgi:hypothetical protein
VIPKRPLKSAKQCGAQALMRAILADADADALASELELDTASGKLMLAVTVLEKYDKSLSLS